MMPRFILRRPLTLLALGVSTAAFTVGALAADLPKRKPGLWEITIQATGMPGMGPMQQCIDQNTDNLMQQRAKQGKTDCSVMDVKPSGNTVTIHSVCKFEGTTATTDAIFSGTFDANYRGEMTTRFNPPMQGISESKMTHQAKWLGPCKPSQKPGDVIMPNVGGINLNEMMKDPKMQEMLKKQMQQQAR